jgi:hypothetical protein
MQENNFQWNYKPFICPSELYNDRSIASNPARGEVYSIQLNVIKFVSELRQVSGYLQFPLPIKLTKNKLLISKLDF